MKLLCRVGLHQWDRWQAYACKHVYSDTKKGCYIGETRQVRRCSSCGLTEDEHISDDLVPGIPVLLDNTEAEKAPLGLD